MGPRQSHGTTRLMYLQLQQRHPPVLTPLPSRSQVRQNRAMWDPWGQFLSAKGLGFGLAGGKEVCGSTGDCGLWLSLLVPNVLLSTATGTGATSRQEQVYWRRQFFFYVENVPDDDYY